MNPIQQIESKDSSKKYNRVSFFVMFIVMSIVIVVAHEIFERFVQMKVLSPDGFRFAYLSKLETQIYGLIGVITPISILGGFILLISLFHFPLNALLAAGVIVGSLMFTDKIWARFRTRNLLLEICFKTLVLMVCSLLIELLVYKQACSWKMLTNTPISEIKNGLGDSKSGCWPIGYSM